jgi:hypothetical protein
MSFYNVFVSFFFFGRKFPLYNEVIRLLTTKTTEIVNKLEFDRTLYLGIPRSKPKLKLR